MEERNPISLRELQLAIKQAVDALPGTYWVVAEVSELRESSAGHCFLELVQKSERDQRLEAKVGATIWASLYGVLRSYFAGATGRPLGVGMKLLVRVSVQYHALYGLRLNVLDVDAAYTVGEVAMQRQRTVQRLRQEGVYDMNRALPMPLLPLRVAIISSPQAAGYGDFLQQLRGGGGAPRYAFRTTLFAATVQGGEAEASLVAALAQLQGRAAEFDVVALLRGGGAQSDLSCFDSYRVASHVAQLPLPVITGIGHERDRSVADLVAHTALKTPTAAAAFLVDKLAGQDARTAQLCAALLRARSAALERHGQRLRTCTSRLALLARQKVAREKATVTLHLPQRLRQACAHRLGSCRQLLSRHESRVALLNPLHVLRRGYSLTLHRGAPLRSAADVRPGDALHTLLGEGSVTSTVTAADGGAPHTHPFNP